MAWRYLLAGQAALRRLGFVLARLALAAIVVAYAYEVVSRYAFGAPTWWSAELVSYLLCAMVFAAMPQVTATRGQVAVTLLLDALGGRWRAGAMRAIAVVGFAVCAGLAVFATGEVGRQIARGVQMMAAHPVPKWWISSWIVFGFAASALEFLRLAVAGADPAAVAAAAEPREY